MKIFISTILLAFALNANAQKLFKDKMATLKAVTEKGYTCAKDQKDSNVYWYKRYDTYGESMVQLTFENNTLRKAIIVHLDPKQTLERLKDVYAKTNNTEADTFEPPSNGYGKGEAYNTTYYSGKARYEYNNNYGTEDYLFTIMPLD